MLISGLGVFVGRRRKWIGLTSSARVRRLSKASRRMREMPIVVIERVEGQEQLMNEEALKYARG